MIRKLKYKLLLGIAGASMLFSSCGKDFITLNPPTSVDPNVALGTPADLLIALRGAYAGTRNVDLFGRTLPVIGDVMADVGYQHSLNTNRYTLFNNYSFNSTDANVAGFWNGAYQVILRANRIIAAPVSTSATVDQYKGEAYALRALMYFTLVQYFARPYTDNPDGLGVPIVLTYDPELKPGRSKVSEVYAQINADLDKAYSMMTTFTNSSQFSKYAAKALQARVYLTMGQWANARTAALDVINNSGFTPLTAANHASYWANSAVRTDKLETLFEVSSDAVGNLAFDALSYIYSQNGNYGDLVVSNEFIPTVNIGIPGTGGTRAFGLVNLTPTGSIASVTITNPGSGYTTAPTITFSAPPFAGTTATGTAVITGGQITGITITNPGSGYTELIPVTDVRRALYPIVARSAPNGNVVPTVDKYPVISGDYSDTKVLRLSEMYFIAAEASYMLNDEANARTYVNFITSRRNAAPITSSGAQLLEDILTEKRKEFAFEGLRYLDLMRLKRDVVRSTNYPSTARTIAYSNFRRILPIPQSEVDANPIIKAQQNPGY
jgi:hypothetical protein